MTKISVLVAVYNSENFLHKCLDSLVNQTLSDIQIICIDDASTDSSLDILNEYSECDGRIEVIHLEKNVGQAKARNIGLKKATGEYICFLDSDDWFSENALQNVVNVFENNAKTDAVLFRVINCYEDNRMEEYPMPIFDVLKGEEAFEASLTWKIHGVYVVKASIHKEYPYDDTTKAYSDDNTTRLHYLRSREVRCSNGVYYYRQNPKSVTHAVNVRRFDYLRANCSMKKQLKQIGVSDRILDIYENVRWLNIIDVYMFYYKHREQLGHINSKHGLKEIKHYWKSIEIKRLSFRNRMKFGYIPFHFSWTVFRIQEELYFFLKKIIRRL